MGVIHMRRLLIASVLLIMLLSACSSDPVISVWGEPTKNKGLVKHALDEETGALTIAYKHTPWDETSVYQDELGFAVGDKLRRTFEKLDEVRSITVIGYAPLLTDNLGNYEWVPRVRFVLTREMYEKINWDNFDPSNLFDVCEGELLR